VTDLIQESKPELKATIVFDTVAKPVILQEATTENNGVMRIRTPFYMGGSVSNAPNFTKRIVWQEKAIPATIAKAKAQLALGLQPITSYARHKHAQSGEHLPIARVVDVEQEGSVGYATVDVFPIKPLGEHVQTLVQNDALTAMSLRTNDYTLVAGKLDGENVLLCEEISLEGLDFAPDGPAQPTYGIKVLSQEAVIETTPEGEPEVPPTPPTKETKLSEQEKQPLTLEAVRAEAPDVVEQIEAPLRAELAKLSKTHEALVQEGEIRDRDTAIAEYAKGTSDPEAFSKLLSEVCQEEKVTTRHGVNAIVAPLLMAELAKRAAAPATPPVKPKKEQLIELFGGATTSQAAVTQEVAAPTGTTDPESEVPVLTGEATAGGLVVPEGW
jgi:hypothetical protein